MKRKIGYWIIGLLLSHSAIQAAEIKVHSITELAKYAAQDGNIVSMQPGVYQMKDYLTEKVVKKTKPDGVGRYAMIDFSGSDNTFDLTGVTIEVDTELLSIFKARVIELYVRGNNLHIKGLTVTDIGNHPTFKGGHSMTVAGDNVKIEKVTLNISGSSPYGYGDLLGKGGGALVRLQKHSGMCIEGLNDSIVDSSIYSKAFGHCFFVQGGRNVYFENCYAEGVTRTTDAMLAETSGLAYDNSFASVYTNYSGEKLIPRGYTKSLNECGFRMYGNGGVKGIKTGAVTAVNCKAKNTRIGFAFGKITDDVLIKDSETIGCEVGYNVGGVTVENSRGDVAHGPLLYVYGDQPSHVEMFLLPTESQTTVHALALISGNDHQVTLSKWRNMTRGQSHPIRIGTTRPPANNGFSPLGSASTSRVVLHNSTGMPVELNSEASRNRVVTNGEVTDLGTDNHIEASLLVLDE
ncbi:hypothetical protein [Reichenbachiella agariperforans]|uniref:hypothetical protein n=1 Tax=Reichenbachiella agariperforans TaxID=156994 RepID=UPI001C086D80|nr:hypothetical protein [Reichenbachiella agariperforans]MBU2914115.1 hypothetical protein [Reichenbachiella agariperforans]